jgi:putative membrane protein
MIDQLNGQAGRNFDRLYVQQQVAAHQEALGVHGGYAQTGDTAPIRSTAASVLLWSRPTWPRRSACTPAWVR